MNAADHCLRQRIECFKHLGEGFALSEVISVAELSRGLHPR